MLKVPKTPKPRSCEWDGYTVVGDKEFYWHCEDTPDIEVRLDTGAIMWVCLAHYELAKDEGATDA